MAHASFRVSAPGSIMLLGEHAVLHGRQALVCAVAKRIQVHLAPREDDQVRVSSPLGEHGTTTQDLQASQDFRFVMGAIARRKKQLPSGFDLRIESDFSSEMGLGSSSAVTVATVAALAKWLGLPHEPQNLFDESVAVVRDVQGMGSGADVAASVFGGVVAYRMKPVSIRKLHSAPPITLVYSGHKEPTVKVVKIVEGLRKAQPKLFNFIFDVMDRSVPEASQAIESRNWSMLGQVLNLNQGLMDAIGVNTRALADIVFLLREQPGISGAKISGAGLGDCVVGVGEASLADGPYTPIPTEVSMEGVSVD